MPFFIIIQYMETYDINQTPPSPPMWVKNPLGACVNLPIKKMTSIFTDSCHILICQMKNFDMLFLSTKGNVVRSTMLTEAQHGPPAKIGRLFKE